MLSKTNEMLNENNNNNLKDVGEEEEEINIMNENKIEDPKEEDIHGNDFAEEDNKNKRTETVATLNINEIINIKNVLISAKQISKEENLEFISLYNSFFLVSFSKKCQLSDYYIHSLHHCGIGYGLSF